MQTETVSRTYLLVAEEMDAFAVVADAQGISSSALLRMVVRDFLKREARRKRVAAK